MYLDRQRYTVFWPYTICRPNTKTKISRTSTQTHKRSVFFSLDVAIRNSIRSNKINQEVSCPPGDVAGKTEQQYEETEYDQVRKGRTGKPKHNKNIFGAAAAVCGRGSIVGRGSTYLLCCRSGPLLPCLPSPSCFVSRVFPSTVTIPPPYSLGCHPQRVWTSRTV